MSAKHKVWRCGLVACLSLAGCRHQVYLAAIPNVTVPTISVPPPTHRTEPLPMMEVETLPLLTLQLPRQPLPRFRPRPTTARQLALLLPPLPPPVTLGELSTGGEYTDGEFRRQTETLLRSQQQRLQNLPHASVSLHTQQVEQARLFLRQALEAWHAHDIEGTRILANKTKLLLDEI